MWQSSTNHVRGASSCLETRILTFLVGDSYKPPFATATGRGPHTNSNGWRSSLSTPSKQFRWIWCISKSFRWVASRIFRWMWSTSIKFMSHHSDKHLQSNRSTPTAVYYSLPIPSHGNRHVFWTPTRPRTPPWESHVFHDRNPLLHVIIQPSRWCIVLL